MLLHTSATVSAELGDQCLQPLASVIECHWASESLQFILQHNNALGMPRLWNSTIFIDEKKNPVHHFKVWQLAQSLWSHWFTCELKFFWYWNDTLWKIKIMCTRDSRGYWNVLNLSVQITVGPSLIQTAWDQSGVQISECVHTFSSSIPR